MGMVTGATTKFYDHIDKQTTNEIFFRFGNMVYQICFSGHYIQTEDLNTGMEEEYCFPQKGNDLIEAFLNARVNEAKNKSVREILAELPENELIVTN